VIDDLTWSVLDDGPFDELRALVHACLEADGGMPLLIVEHMLLGRIEDPDCRADLFADHRRRPAGGLHQRARHLGRPGRRGAAVPWPAAGAHLSRTSSAGSPQRAHTYAGSP